MPENLRALTMILVLAGAVFAAARPLACAAAMTEEDFVRRRNLWFALTLVAFLAHNFWLFIAFAALLLVFALPGERNKLALYFFLLFAVPAIDAEIPGFGLVEHFFAIDYLRLLALTILLPAWFALRARPEAEPFGRSAADKLLLAYLALQFLLQLPHATLTETLRKGVFYAFVDVFLPYYVASRAARDLAALREALMAFVLGALVAAAIGVFELARHWLLYSPLEEALEVNWGLLNYLERGDGLLRAQASTGQPIILGYVLALALCLALYLRRSMPPTRWRDGGLVLLTAGLVAAMSRGPWIGTAVMLLAFVATGPRALARLAKLGLAGLCVLPFLLVSSAGQALVDYLPFVGTVEAQNITYRERLFEVSLDVVLDHPFFGAWDFLQLPVMQQLRQGQGIIDIVNTYLGVALASGLVGLALFCGFFLVVLAELFAAMRRAAERGRELLADREGEAYALGQALFCALLGILVMISTTSSIGLIALIYWAIAGLAQAYARVPALARADETEQDGDSRLIAAS
jgi:O-antigen ligase